jgi:outer membrane murein-binding lipoprotein Lpp
MKYTLVATAAALILAGCASKSEDITASYVSPVAYQNFTCDQLQQEAEGISARAAEAAGQQDKARKNDQVKTAVGVVLFWPVLLFNEGDGRNAAELANLKGQMNAIQSASTKKKCGFQFQS